MATMIPVLSEAQLEGLRSRAEAKLYRACRDQLDPSVLVIHSLALVRLTKAGSHEDGEADFVIIDPRRGVIVIEVKGGGVEFEPGTGEWTSINKEGRTPIKDPFRQAVGYKHALMDYFGEIARVERVVLGRVLFGHGVFFPDLNDVDRLRLPSTPRDIIGSRATLDGIERWVAGIFDYWAGSDPRTRYPSADELHFFKRLLCSPVRVTPLLSAVLSEEEQVRIQLTQQQARLLRALGMRRRAMICGGAGTGKTLLALERARELAAAGHRTLLLCFNRPLADHFKVAVEGVPRLEAMTFHQLCDWRIRVTYTETGKDLMGEATQSFPGEDQNTVLLPYALARSVEETSLRYEAIVVDEAQDFATAFWLGIDELLADSKTSWFYVFSDHNQVLYERAAKPPVEEAPFLLTANCRNTRPIHDAAYRFYSGEATDGPSIEGAPIEHLVANTVEAQANRIVKEVIRLINEEQVAPKDIAVLVIYDQKKPVYDALKKRPLPRPASFSLEKHRVENTVLVDTVARFKGLEASIVFLCGLEGVSAERDRELIYVGLSRAKSRVYLVGSERAMGRLVMKLGLPD